MGPFTYMIYVCIPCDKQSLIKSILLIICGLFFVCYGIAFYMINSHKDALFIAICTGSIIAVIGITNVMAIQRGTNSTDLEFSECNAAIACYKKQTYITTGLNKKE